MVDKVNKIYKKLAVLLSIVMVVAMMPAMAMAEDELQDGVAKDTENREAAKQDVNPNQQVQGVYVSVMGVDGADILSGMFTELADNSTVYDVITYMFNAQMVPYDITPERINSIGGVGPNTTGGEKPAWFFAINSKLADKSVGQAKLKHGDILRVFYVKNADTARLGYIEPIGALGNHFNTDILEEKDAKFIYANSNDSIILELMSTSLNFQNLSVQKEPNCQANVNVGTVTQQPSSEAGIGKTYTFSQKTADTVLALKPTTGLGYELIPAFVRVLDRPETILGYNFYNVYKGWLESSKTKLLELDWLSRDTEAEYYGLIESNDYDGYNYLAALMHKDMYNNDMKLTGLSFKNQAGKYLNMVQKDDPLSGFSPYNMDYSLGNTPDNITLQYSRLGAMLTVSVEVPQGVTYDSATGAISGLEGKKGKIDIKVENTELYKHTIYTVYFDNTVLPQVDFAAYLPGYGQFVNEYINDGGWGDAYLVGTTGRKNMLNHIESTGVSLGSFGGYAIFDFGVDGIKNDPKNKYGVDFIAYGNAFVGNSEPGGIQVSADGTNWYNIAGSRHYADSTVWDYTVEHTNPVAADDDLVPNPDPPQGTFQGNTNHIFPTISKARPESAEQPGTFTMTHNTWHQHSWYPLFANYFKSRKDGDLPLANLALSQKFATYTPKTGNTASKIKLKGTKINFTSMQAADYTFGYCDVHPNGSNYGVAANPYVATGSTQGGDGIDISWAVDANGAPVHLDAIRYVRIYTGVMKDNPPFGETSTEVCGVYNVNPQAEIVGVTAAPEVQLDDAIIAHTNGGIKTINAEESFAFKVRSDADNVYVNGIKVNAGSEYSVDMEIGSQEVKYVQVIAQTGNNEPYITVFKIVGN